MVLGEQELPHLPGEQEPILDEIVVAPEGSSSAVDDQVSHGEATKGSSQQQPTQNDNDRPAFLQNANTQERDTSTRPPTAPKYTAQLLKDNIVDAVDEKARKKPQEKQPATVDNERELEDQNDGVDVAGKGNKGGSTPSDQQGSEKKNGKRVYCQGCTRRKNTPGPNGGRLNAKYRCKACKWLTNHPELQGTAAARQERPEPGNSQPGRSQRRQEARKEKLLAERRRAVKGAFTDLPRGGKALKVAAAPKAQQQQDLGSEPSTEDDDPSNPPVPNASNPLVDGFGATKVPSLQQIQEKSRQWIHHPHPEAAGPKADIFDKQDQPVFFNDAAAPERLPLLLRPENEPAPGSPPKTMNPALLTRKPSQVADDSSPGFKYPDPMQLEISSITTHFKDAVQDLELSNTMEASMESRLTSASGSHSTPEEVTSYANTSKISPPALSNFSNIPTPANQAPTDLPQSENLTVRQPIVPIDPQLQVEAHQTGLKTSSIDPTLTQELRDFSAPKHEANSGVGTATNDGAALDKAGDDMFDQYIIYPN